MDETPIPREHYMSKLRTARNQPFVKVLTGIRKCGKSTLMGMIVSELKASGVPDECILSVNLEDELLGIDDWNDLLEYIRIRLPEPKGSYLFLDEVQSVDDWERVVKTYFISGADVYVTGSNSEMLSTEISTRLSGSTLEIRVQPLAFSEYVRFRPDAEHPLDDYIRRGGFPAVALAMDRMPSQVGDLLEGIYSTVFNKDVLGRHEIRSPSAISNLSVFLMKNIGDRTSVRSVANYLTSKSLKTQPETVQDYLGYLEEALLFGRAKRFDSKSKEYLRTADKFFVADVGIRGVKLPFSMDDLDGIMENIVYNELLYRYGDAAVCAVDGLEVDFVADPSGKPSYYQVSVTILDTDTRGRELRPLREIGDNYPKTIITWDRMPTDDLDGIRVVCLEDWLMESSDAQGF